MPASVAASPSLRATPDTGQPGDDVVLHGRNWDAVAGCSNRIYLSFRQNGRRLRLGSAFHGDGRFDFATHYQEAEPGSARFVAVQQCADRTIRRSAYVTIGGGSDTVRYRGQTEHGGRVSFVVIDGNEVRKFRFVNRCSSDRRFGSLVPGGMQIGDVSFARRGRQFTIFGRFRAGGRATGFARERTGGCDSTSMSWTVHRTD